jgi:hypothetical protein
VSAFAESELGYLATRRLAHIATIGADGAPHVVPVGSWRHNVELDVIEVRGRAGADGRLLRIHPDRVVSWGLS